MALHVNGQKDQEEKAHGQEHPQRLDGRHQGDDADQKDRQAEDRLPVGEPLCAAPVLARVPSRKTPTAPTAKPIANKKGRKPGPGIPGPDQMASR